MAASHARHHLVAAVDRRRPGEGLQALAGEDAGLHRLFISLGIVDEIELVCRPALGSNFLMLRQLGLSSEAAFAVVGKLVQTMNGMPRSVGKDAEPGPIVGPAPWPVRVDP